MHRPRAGARSGGGLVPEVPHVDTAGLTWRESSHRDPQSAGVEGVEVAPLPDGGVAVRNSGHREGPVLVYTRAEMTAFVLGAKDGEFDDLLESA
ncbi:DUF397 domain-containing protein [Actinomycetospora sp. CA-101289]|uniref:DUF397 domain-containing protein n=1 Tax=Actinomycetospora sp. CA-101289 TaxID=3239893 RepID=UPI003D97E7FD